MNKYLSEHFPGLILQKPLFYLWPIGLRLEIGPSETPLWQNNDKQIINKKYFAEALKRSISIFKFLFEDEDDLILVYQKFSDGRQKIKKQFFLFKQINTLSSKTIIYSDEKNLYLDQDEAQPNCYGWKRVQIKIQTQDINIKNVLTAIINKDFSSRTPRLSGECYFINKSKNIILHLYDDRGMDIIASDKDVLTTIYSTYNNWLLDFDRERMDAIFKD